MTKELDQKEQAAKADFDRRFAKACSDALDNMSQEERLGLIKSLISSGKSTIGENTTNEESSFNYAKDFLEWFFGPTIHCAHALLDKLTGKEKKRKEERARKISEFDAQQAEYVKTHPFRYVKKEE